MFELTPGKLSLAECQRLLKNGTPIALSEQAVSTVEASYNTVKSLCQADKPIYGINTGFGILANAHIAKNDLTKLQYNLIVSHATGVGAPLDETSTRLMMLIKINNLAQGYSGVSTKLLNTLIGLYNNDVIPLIPCQGSVGASGDLAPLSHMSLILLGLGKAIYRDKLMDGRDVLKALSLEPLSLEPKEGLALINGTQTSTALALSAYYRAQSLFEMALMAGALSVDGMMASYEPFDERIHQLRRLPEQIEVAAALRSFLQGSPIQRSHQNCGKVQDPYSFRCQPQVMGSILKQLNQARDTLECEINAVTDNPLVFADTKEILSGGNFHAEPIALLSDSMANAIAEMGSLSERRISILMDPAFTDLPAFLSLRSGLHSGLMLAQVTAASLVSENKTLCFPASVDSIPTSLNQEDHVSMATHGARRLHAMLDNATNIIALEFICALQALDLRGGLQSSSKLEKVRATVRNIVPFLDEDRPISDDIVKIAELIRSGALA